MSVRTHHPWPSVALGLLGVAVGSSYLTKAVGNAGPSGTDLVIGLLCLALGIGALVAACQRWDRSGH